MLFGGSYFTAIGGYDLRTLYSKYGFRRAVCGDYEVNTYTSAGFAKSQLLISIGYNNNGVYVLNPSWQRDVDTLAGSVLGFWMDEPSAPPEEVPYSTMSSIKNYIASHGSKLWLEDYDTGVIPYAGLYPYYYLAAHTYHIADQTDLNYGDYIFNNGNTSVWISGANQLGVGPYLSSDYNEFQNWFGYKFNGIACQPMDGSGALMNDATMYNLLINYVNVNNFAIYLGKVITNINDNDVSARKAAITNLMNDASTAGFVGHQYQCYNYTYICQTNCVNFTPPNCPIPPSPNNVGAGTSVYFGVWTNNSYYRGPVDQSTPGATVCWTLQTTAPTNQFVNVY